MRSYNDLGSNIFIGSKRSVALYGSKRSVTLGGSKRKHGLHVPRITLENKDKKSTKNINDNKNSSRSYRGTNIDCISSSSGTNSDKNNSFGENPKQKDKIGPIGLPGNANLKMDLNRIESDVFENSENTVKVNSTYDKTNAPTFSSINIKSMKKNEQNNRLNSNPDTHKHRPSIMINVENSDLISKLMNKKKNSINIEKQIITTTQPISSFTQSSPISNKWASIKNTPLSRLRGISKPDSKSRASIMKN